MKLTGVERQERHARLLEQTQRARACIEGFVDEVLAPLGGDAGLCGSPVTQVGISVLRIALTDYKSIFGTRWAIPYRRRINLKPGETLDDICFHVGLQPPHTAAEFGLPDTYDGFRVVYSARAPLKLSY